MKALREFIKLVGAALLGAILAGGMAYAATGFVIFGANGGTATVTNGKLDVNAAATVSGSVVLGAGANAIGSLVGVPLTPIVSAAAENNHVLKASAGTLFTVCAVNITTTPGYLIVLNSTTSPGDGAVTPLDVAPLPGSGSGCITLDPLQGHTYSTGITAVVTSAATPFTKTTGVITAFISGGVQ